jgi:hypothetical protein
MISPSSDFPFNELSACLKLSRNGSSINSSSPANLFTIEFGSLLLSVQVLNGGKPEFGE